ncbi:MAG: hypothetical protein IAE97_08460 [Chthoniobacterales bacterium]|nr:hypothetical protein [Chthoniobacterales bacterium]
MRRDGCMPLRPGTGSDGAVPGAPRASAWRTCLGILPVVLLLFSGTVHAIDLTLTNGTVLRDVQLRGKTDLGIRVQHKDGMVFIDYAKIDPSELQTWGFEETKYQAASAAASSRARAEPAPSTSPKPTPSPSPTPEPTASPEVTAERTDTAAKGKKSQGDAKQCAAITKKGTRCTRDAQPGREYCYQHP